MIKAALALLALAVLPMTAYAADTSSGCGVGWHVTGSTTLSATSTRGTTNAFLPNTFSMTSGTSGCARHAIAQKDMPAYEYVVVNRDALDVEMAQGRGENLAALARTMGCGDASIARFGQVTQSAYPEIVGDGMRTNAEIFHQVQDQVAADPALGIACHT